MLAKINFYKLLFVLLIFLAPLNVFAQNDYVIAKVNNHIISAFDLQERYQFVISSAKIKVNNSEEKKILLMQIIDKMIDEELILQEAEKLKIAADHQEINNAIASVAASQRKSVAELKNYFASHNLSFFAFQKQVKADLLWSQIVGESLRSHIKITDSEINEFFEQKKQNNDIIQYKIAEIFIAQDKDAKLLASKLKTELKQGANFKNIVKQFSQSPTAENAGELGWVTRHDIDDKIYKAISNLDKGGYSDEIFLTEGYYIFKLLDKKTITKIKDEELDEARNTIFAKHLRVEAKKYLMEMRKNSYIEINYTRLSDF